MRYKERLEDVQRWSWKVFCALWADLIDYTAQEQERRAQEQAKAELRRLRGMSGDGW